MQTTTSPIRITTREREILSLISKQYTAKEIADMLYLSKHTVMSHRKNLMEKLSARNGAGLMIRALELGFLELAVTAA